MQDLLGHMFTNWDFLRSKVRKGVYFSVYLAWVLKRKTDLAIKLERLSQDNRLVKVLRIDINWANALNHLNAD